MNPLDLMQNVAIAWERGDYATLRKLLHPHGSWVVLSSDDALTITDRDTMIEALRYVQEKTSYRVYTMEHEVLSSAVVLASGYIRTPAGKHGHRVARHHFLLEAKDGLLYRREHFLSESDARAALADGWGEVEHSSAVAAKVPPIPAKV